MLPSIEQLLVVQDRDQKLKIFRAELSALPSEKQRIEHALSSSSTGLEQLKQRSRDLEVQRKKFELDVRSRQEQAARYRSQQMQTRKNEEYQVLGNEIARVELEIVALEDQEIVLMEEAEQLQARIKAAEDAFQTARVHTDEQLAALTSKEQALQAGIAALEQERAEVAKGVDPSLLFQYQRLFTSKGGDAVVPIEHGVCMGCHMKNTATLAHRARLGREVVACEQCGRILYWDGD
ncbi:MAG: hypothetical protein JO069_07205 [Verrucomicrobia bacterium]|nr:hypothetical protein [Verrucomicrobiota bacterium]